MTMTAAAPAATKLAFEYRIVFEHKERRRRYDVVREAMDVRDALVAWVDRVKRDGSPANAFALHHRGSEHAGYLYETELGWVLTIVVSYRTESGDGDRNDVTRGIQRVLDKHRAGTIVNVKRRKVKA